MAQTKIKETQVPKSVLIALEKKYDSYKVKTWYQSPGQYIAQFSTDGQNGYAYFTESTKASTAGNIPQASNTEVAVLNERQIEFLAEGKRWFDLVRYAERHAGCEKNYDGTQDPREWSETKHIGNGKKGVDLMVDNFLSHTFSSSLCASATGVIRK